MGSAVAESLIEETPALGVFAAALALLTLGWEFAAARARWTEVRVPQDSVASRS